MKNNYSKLIMLIFTGMIVFLSCSKDNPPEEKIQIVLPDDPNLITVKATKINTPISNHAGVQYYDSFAFAENKVFWASFRNSAAEHVGFFISYDMKTNQYSSNLPPGNLCACGWSSKLLSNGIELFNIGNEATKYSLSSNAWTDLNFPNSVAMSSPASAYWDGKLYFTGARTGGVAFNSYDIKTGTWTSMPSSIQPNSASSYSGMGAWNNNLYYFLPAAGNVTKVSRFDIAQNKWIAQKDGVDRLWFSPYAEYIGTYGNYIFILQDIANGAKMYLYNPATDTWATKAIDLDFRLDGGNGVLFVHNSKLHFAGLYNKQFILYSFEIE